MSTSLKLSTLRSLLEAVITNSTENAALEQQSVKEQLHQLVLQCYSYMTCDSPTHSKCFLSMLRQQHNQLHTGTNELSRFQSALEEKSEGHYAIKPSIDPSAAGVVDIAGETAPSYGVAETESAQPEELVIVPEPTEVSLDASWVDFDAFLALSGSPTREQIAGRNDDLAAENQLAFDAGSTLELGTPLPVKNVVLPVLCSPVASHSDSGACAASCLEAEAAAEGHGTLQNQGNQMGKRSRAMKHKKRKKPRVARDIDPDLVELSKQWTLWDQNDLSQKQQGSQDQGVASKALSDMAEALAESRKERGMLNVMMHATLGVGHSRGFLTFLHCLTAINTTQATEFGRLFCLQTDHVHSVLFTLGYSGEGACRLRRYVLALKALHFLQTKRAGHEISTPRPTPESLATIDESLHCKGFSKFSTSQTYKFLVKTLWNTEFPAGKVTVDRSGLIKSPDEKGEQWNEHKKRLSEDKKRGMRWLRMAKTFGWSSLSLVAEGWLGELNGMHMSDHKYEILTDNELDIVMRQVQQVRGTFLKSFDRQAGQAVLQLLQGRSQMALEHIIERGERIAGQSGSDSAWLKLFEDVSAHMTA